MKTLFLLKRRDDFKKEVHTKIGLQTGLYNSANFMNEMLKSQGIESNIEVVHDNNDIDREVTKHRPDVVFIEGLWVVPEKFYVLSKLHPNVLWVVRIHSDTPFLAQEGIAFDWIMEYNKHPRMMIAPNSPKMFTDLEILMDDQKLVYLPNYYPLYESYKVKAIVGDEIHVGCFGAIRPLKNHLIQALACIKMGRVLGKKVFFHVNADRFEMNGQPVYNNLIGLSKNVDPSLFELILHPWVEHDDFLKLCGQMDIGMQVSYTETFNIVAADMVNMGVPVLCSSEIPWAQNSFMYSCNDFNNSIQICYKMINIYNNSEHCVDILRNFLKLYSEKSKETWIKFLGDVK